MSCFTDIENKPDDWLVLDPLTIQKPIPKTGCDTNLLVLNYLSEFKTDALKLKVKDNLGIFTDTILAKDSNNPIANKTVYKEFNRIKSNMGLNSISWTVDSDMNNYTEEGIYYINGERIRQDDNLPILNVGIISAQLNVIISENINNLIVTQILSLNNNIGGEGNIYIRSCQNGEWKAWGKLQTNIEVGVVNQEQLDALVDNGIYSGILSTTGETFVIICINNYAIAQQVGVHHISHLKYSLVAGTGEVKIEKRTRNAYGFWTEWAEYGLNDKIINIESRAVDSDRVDVETEAKNVKIDFATLDGAHSKDITIPAATTNKAGMMTAEDKVNLANSTVTDINWSNSSNMNNYTTAGVYHIKGERLNTADNLPIANSNPGHTIDARLTVLDSSITGTGDSQDKCITLVLTLSNRTGEDGNMYMRTGSGVSLNSLSWEPWATLQTNINVGAVNTLDNFKDNGIYSGVWTKGSYNAYPLTFVCIVINDYIVGIAPRRISQFVYGLSKLNGSTVYQTRVWDDSKNAWGDWEILNQKEISSMISNEIKKVTDGVDPEKLDSLKDLIAWVDTHGGEVAGIKSDIQANEAAIEKEAERAIEAEEKLEEKIANEKTALVNGDTIVGQAREVYSRTGKVDSATFLKRTTAGGTSISDGMASVKQIGGNIVKNLVGNVNDNGWKVAINSCAISTNNGIMEINPTTETYQQVAWGITLDSDFRVTGHKYYYRCYIKSANADNNISLGVMNYRCTQKRVVVEAASTSEWQALSAIIDITLSNLYLGCAICDKRAILTTLYAKDFCVIDLTEMFGAGNEPTKEECDRMFGTMDALPQGLTIAQPTGLKSTGFNQWNPANVLLNKSIVENAIEDDVADRHIAIVECLPCKIGTGENNGYIIGYGEGDSWSVEGIEVYFSPLNPMDYIGQDVDLYMHKLEADSDYSTYVPQIKGYLLVVTPTTDKLCAHFHWSGDREITDYEEYVESNVTLPTIPEMSEWGLAGIQSSGTLAADTIDLDRMVYTKRIGCVDLGSLNWGYNQASKSFVDWDSIKNIVKKPEYGKVANAMSKYANDAAVASIDRPLNDFSFMIYNDGSIFIKDDSYNNNATAFKQAMRGVMLYYELATPEEYPIVTKTAPNYIGSDYGVEEFTGSKIPLAANILFYMRSLVSETRNFLDRLMARLGISDATAVADKIADAIIPAAGETDVEPTEVIEE